MKVMKSQAIRLTNAGIEIIMVGHGGILCNIRKRRIKYDTDF